MASAVSATVTARVWVTPPGAPSASAVDMVWIESIDEQVRAQRVDVPEHGAEVGLGGQVQLVVHGAGALGAQPDLPRRLLAGHVQHAPALAAFAATSSSSVDLPTPGSPGEQHDRAGDQPAAEHAVQLGDAGRAGAGGVQLDVGDPARRAGRGAGGDRARRAVATAGRSPPGVPQAWQDGQRPTHCADRCPHSAQR